MMNDEDNRLSFELRASSFFRHSSFDIPRGGYQKKHPEAAGPRGAKDFRYFRGDWLVSHLRDACEGGTIDVCL